MDLIVYQIDSFTDDLFLGNPAGVVLNAENLNENTMQKIARELNNSETAFIINRKSDDYDMQVRFFTPLKEVPICGHATIGAHFAWAVENKIKNAVIKQKTGAGILPVEIAEIDGKLRITMTQAEISYGDRIEGSQLNELINGFGIKKEDLDYSLPVRIVSTGHSKVMVPIRSKEILDNITINSPVLTKLSSQICCNGFYGFTFDSGEEGVLISGRMFAPAIGIAEDPVTGNANGPLGAYLTLYNRIEKRKEGFTFRIKQGEAINRKGYMDVHVYSSNEGAEMIKISGNARVVFRTIITIT